MRLTASILLAAVLLTACGGGGSSSAPGAVDACALISQPDTLFGAGAEHVVSAQVEGAAGSCQWRAANGARGGDLIVYTAQSLHGTTPAAQFAHFTETWGGMSSTPLAPIAGLGDEAQIATGLPGYQAQVVMRKGDKVAALLAWSGDPAMTDEALARGMAQAAAAGL